MLRSAFENDFKFYREALNCSAWASITILKFTARHLTAPRGLRKIYRDALYFSAWALKTILKFHREALYGPQDLRKRS